MADDSHGMIRRINFFAGPGCGKSTLAAEVFSKLKKKHYNVELVREYIKQMVYEGRTPCSFEQNYIFAKQQRLEDRVLAAGVELVVTDSPLYLQCFYARAFNHSCSPELMSMSEKFEKEYPSLNLFLLRHDGEYQTQGRYQTQDEAVKIDTELKVFLNDLQIPFVEVSNDAEQIVSIIDGMVKHG